MKTYKLFIACSLLLLTMSCQNMVGTPSTGDYHAGRFAGEEAAKQDVLDTQSNIGRASNVSVIRENIGKHLKQIETPLSDAYIKGFKWGYKRAFVTLNDAYNGGG
ncbi:hypothetical protein [Desulfocicer niacini]